MNQIMMNKLKLFGILSGALVSGAINAQTNADFTWENTCLNQPSILTSTSVTPDSIVNYEWDIDNDGLFDEYVGLEVVNPIFFESRIWPVGLKVTTDQGDIDTVYIDVTVTNVPVANFATNETCINDAVLFTNQATLNGGSITRIIWNFGDATSEELVGNVSKRYTNAVTFDATQIVESDALCRDTIVKMVALKDAPETMILTENGVLEIAKSQNLTLSLNEQTQSVNWSTGATTEEVVVNNPGVYYATGVDLDGCNFRDTITVNQITNRNAIYNAFSPNNDGQNDFWKIKNIDLYETVAVKVFDKRGALVLDEENYQNDWEGDFNGDKLAEGVYFYHVILNGDTENTLIGTVSILSAE